MTPGPIDVNTLCAAQPLMDKQILSTDGALPKPLMKVSELKTFNQGLKHARNTYSTISILPAELLGAIFVEARQSYWESLKRDDHDIWIYAVSGVCSRWRGTARHTPRYWGFISLTVNSRPTLDALHLSGSTPLRVRGRITGYELGLSNLKLAYDALLLQFPRIQQFDMILPPSDARVSDQIPYPAPILDSLSIKYSITVHRVELPAQMNALCTLELFNAIPSAELPPLPSLTKLSITTDQSPSSPSIYLTWLVHSLQNTPILEVLVVNIFQFTNDAVSDAASLPCLSYFSFSTSLVSGTMTLFDFVNHPNTTRIVYTQTSGRPTAKNSSSIRNLLTRFGDQMEKSINQICVSGDACFGMSVYTKCSPCEPQIVISLPKETRNIQYYMPILAALPIDTVPGLALSGFNRSLSSASFNLFEPFRAVKVMKISQCTQDVLKELHSYSAIPIFPNLRCIILSECDGQDHILAELILQLEHRRKSGLADLEKIYIFECDLDSDDEPLIENLQDFCEVEWDGLFAPRDAWESESESSESSESSDSSVASIASGDALIQTPASASPFIVDVHFFTDP
ncbi:hypothetical protein ONZ45_g12708 [Pleurotus djamor]|nr:hypothetical protein ONZ45_g12708 [Pleurotus djamor]